MAGVGFSTKIPCGLYNSITSKIITSNKKSSSHGTTIFLGESKNE